MESEEPEFFESEEPEEVCVLPEPWSSEDGVDCEDCVVSGACVDSGFAVVEDDPDPPPVRLPTRPVTVPVVFSTVDPTAAAGVVGAEEAVGVEGVVDGVPTEVAASVTGAVTVAVLARNCAAVLVTVATIGTAGAAGGAATGATGAPPVASATTSERGLAGSGVEPPLSGRPPVTAPSASTVPPREPVSPVTVPPRPPATPPTVLPTSR